MLKSILAITISSFAATAALAQPESPGGQPYWIGQAKALAEPQGITVGEAVRRHRLQMLAERQNQRFADEPGYVGARFNKPGSPLGVEYFFSKGSANKPISDSGGPWFYVDTAYGIHSGNVEWDGRTRDFYSPAANLSRMGISVITQ